MRRAARNTFAASITVQTSEGKVPVQRAEPTALGYPLRVHRATETAIRAGEARVPGRGNDTLRDARGGLACLIEDFRLSGIRAHPDHASLFNGHQS